MRLDPTRTDQGPFRIRREWLKELWPELTNLRYEHGKRGEIKLENAEDYALRLRHSPDLQAAFCQLFMDGTHGTNPTARRTQTPAEYWGSPRR